MPASTSAIEKPAKIRRSARKLNREKVLDLRAKGVPIRDIAKTQGVHSSTIARFFQGNLQAKESLAVYKANRADIFAEVQAKGLRVQSQILDSLVGDRVLGALAPHQKASILQAVNVVVGTIYDKERLELGKSTQNVGLIARMMGDSLGRIGKATSNGGDPTPETPVE